MTTVRDKVRDPDPSICTQPLSAELGLEPAQMGCSGARSGPNRHDDGMIDHVTVQVADVPRSRQVYESLLGTLGVAPLATDGDGVGFCNGNVCGFWLVPAQRHEARELHLAFKASTRMQVHDFHAAAVALGLEVLHTPQVFEAYGPDYFATFVRDPDGHNIEAVCRTTPTSIGGETA